jgi:hypothetical protein
MMAHYLRALVLALKLTLRGRRIAPKHPALAVWAREAARRVDIVYRSADANGLNEAARKAFILHLEGRDISMETILALVRHHAALEYVKLLLDSTPHTFVAIYASNLNDRYRIEQLCNVVQQPLVKTALASLSQHLGEIPSQPNPKNM